MNILKTEHINMQDFGGNYDYIFRAIPLISTSELKPLPKFISNTKKVKKITCKRKKRVNKINSNNIYKNKVRPIITNGKLFCGICNAKIVYNSEIIIGIPEIYPNYCPECGVMLDWSDGLKWYLHR